MQKLELEVESGKRISQRNAGRECRRRRCGRITGLENAVLRRTMLKRGRNSSGSIEVVGMSGQAGIRRSCEAGAEIWKTARVPESSAVRRQRSRRTPRIQCAHERNGNIVSEGEENARRDEA